MYLDRYKPHVDLIFKIIRFNRVYDHRGYLHKSGEKRRDNYIKKFKHLEYICREIATHNCYLSSEQLAKLLYLKKTNVDDYLLYLENISKKTEKNSGIYTKYGPLKKENIYALKNKLKNIDDHQNIWETVLWFNYKLVKSAHLFDYKNINLIIKNNLEYLFSKYMLTTDKLYWYFTIHINTNALHIHLDIIENEKTLISYNKNREKINTYINFGMFKIEHIELFKTMVRKSCQKLSKEYAAQARANLHWQQKINDFYPTTQDYDWFEIRQTLIDLKFKMSPFLTKSLEFIRDNTKKIKTNGSPITRQEDLDFKSQDKFKTLLAEYFQSNTYLYNFIKDDNNYDKAINLILNKNQSFSLSTLTAFNDEFLSSESYKHIAEKFFKILLMEINFSNNYWKKSFTNFIDWNYYRLPEIIKNNFTRQLLQFEEMIEKEILKYLDDKKDAHLFKNLITFEKKVEQELAANIREIESEDYISQW